MQLRIEFFRKLVIRLSGRRHEAMPDSVSGLIKPSYSQVVGDYEEIRLHRAWHIPVFDVAANNLEPGPISAAIELGGPVYYAFVVDAPLYPAIGRSRETPRADQIDLNVECKLRITR